MDRTRVPAVLLVASLALMTGGCAKNLSPAEVSAQARQRAAFEAARDRCGITVAETPAVQQCMRAQGWAYRLPWQ